MTIVEDVQKIKAVAFDFDGTLADSFPVFVHAIEYALGRKPFTSDEIAELRQYSMREVIKIFKVKKWKLPWLIAKGMKEIDRHQDEITLFTGIPEIIKKLADENYKLYVVSSHSDKGIRALLEQHGLLGYFDHIYSKVGLFGKPKALKKLQRDFGYTASECVFIGDEIRDIEAAEKASMRCIVVAWGFNTTASLKQHSPTVLIEKPKKLPQAIAELS